MTRYIYQVHIADGFVDDCDELIHRCTQHEPLTFHQFTDIWKEMNMAGIYRERTAGAEIAELSEEVVHIGKRYMVANTSNFEESVAGLFLVYGLLNVQPFKGFAALRIVPDDVPAISRIELVARRTRRLDVLYVLGCVLIKGPVQYHAENREYGFDQSLRKYLEGYTGIAKSGIRPKGVFYRQNEELDILRDLGNLTKQYEEAKAKIIDVQGRPDPNLTYADRELPTKLESSLKKIINGIIEDDKNEAESVCMSNERTDRIRAIKARAMRNNVAPIRHRSGVVGTGALSDSDRDAEVLISPRRKADIVSKPGKVKSGNPRRPVTTGSPRKKPQTIIIHTKGKKKSKLKKNKYASSESSDTEEYSDFKDTDDDVDVINSVHDESSDESRKRVEVSIADINNMNTPNVQEFVGQEYDIEIETMPIIIKGSTSQNFQIEIIDQYKPVPKDVSVIDAKNKLIRLPDISVAKVGKVKADKVKEKAGESSKSMNEPAVISKVEVEVNSLEDTETSTAEHMPPSLKGPKGYNLRKPEKRELKRPILKSKFKRLGLENLANFDNNKKRKL